MIQFDTIGRGVLCAKRIRRVLERIRFITGFSVTAQQPIKQEDSFNCGVHSIELICQLASGNNSPEKYLTREEICDTLVNWGYLGKFH